MRLSPNSQCQLCDQQILQIAHCIGCGMGCSGRVSVPCVCLLLDKKDVSDQSFQSQHISGTIIAYAEEPIYIISLSIFNMFRASYLPF